MDFGGLPGPRFAPVAPAWADLDAGLPPAVDAARLRAGETSLPALLAACFGWDGARLCAAALCLAPAAAFLAEAFPAGGFVLSLALVAETLLGTDLAAVDLGAVDLPAADLPAADPVELLLAAGTDADLVAASREPLVNLKDSAIRGRSSIRIQSSASSS